MVEPGTPGRSSAAGARPDIRGAFEAHGPAGAPVLVMLHGTRRTRAMWSHQVAGLADAFRVLTVDLPGHGALADVPFRLGDATALVRAIVEAAGGGRAIVVGQSLGGYVGMDLAARHPGQVAGLVLAGASAEPRWIARRAPRTVGAYLLEAAGERFRGRGGATDGDPDGDDPPDSAGGASVPPATNGWLFKGGTRAMVSALREAFVPRLAAFPGPTLIVNGEDDRLFRHGEDAFLAVTADGRLEVIAGCGHRVNEEQPAAFNAAVRRFAAEVIAPAGLSGST